MAVSYVYWITVVCRIFVLHGVKVLDGFGTCHITVMVIHVFCVVYLDNYIPIFVEICRRSMRFIAACLQHGSSFMIFLVPYVFCSCCFSIWHKY